MGGEVVRLARPALRRHCTQPESDQTVRGHLQPERRPIANQTQIRSRCDAGKLQPALAGVKRCL